jgi:hypothetical protein
MHRLLLCFITAASLAPCTTVRSRAAELTRLAQHRRQWDRRGFSAYTFDLSEGLGRVIGGPFRVTVEGRRVVRFVTEFGDVGGEASGMPTIDALFDSVRTSLDYGQTVRICYDTRLGYPVSFASNTVGQEWSTVFVTTVSKLHPLR